MKKLLHDIKDPEEKLFIKTILEYAQKRDRQHQAFFTDFYNTEWIHQVINKHVGFHSLANYELFGGYANAERQVLGLLPKDDENPLFPIGCLKITVKTGIGKSLSHRDFLGSVLGLGIERSTIGDIIIKPFGAYLIIQKKMIDFILISLSNIGKYHHIEMEEVPFTELEIEEPKVKEILTTVASLRIDVVAAAGFGISRTTCSKLILGDKVKCNGVCVPPHYILKEEDMISLRGYGKIKFKRINGLTKKDRVHICIEKYI